MYYAMDIIVERDSIIPNSSLCITAICKLQMESCNCLDSIPNIGSNYYIQIFEGGKLENSTVVFVFGFFCLPG
jgi:hypothetical protein